MENLIPVKTSLAALNIYDDDDDDDRNKPSVHKMMNILSLQNTNPINNKLRFSFVLPTVMNHKLSSRRSLWRTRLICAPLGWVHIEYSVRLYPNSIMMHQTRKDISNSRKWNFVLFSLRSRSLEL